MKTCSKCKQLKEDMEFAQDKNQKSGLTCRCKQCLRKYHKDYVLTTTIKQERCVVCCAKNVILVLAT